METLSEQSHSGQHALPVARREAPMSEMTQKETALVCVCMDVGVREAGFQASHYCNITCVLVVIAEVR